MAFSFPSSPSIGQAYTYGTTTWKWDGTHWWVSSNNQQQLYAGTIAARPIPSTYTAPTLWSASDDNLGSLTSTDGIGGGWAYRAPRVGDVGRVPVAYAEQQASYTTTYRAGWVNPATYAVADVVTDPGDSGNTYVNIITTSANTQPHLDLTHWTKLTNGGVVLSDFTMNITAVTGDTLHFDGNFYLAAASTVPVVSLAAYVYLCEDGVVIRAAQIPNLTVAPFPAWVTGTVYIVGDTVKDGATYYRNILAVTGSTAPHSDATHWTAIAAGAVPGETGNAGVAPLNFTYTPAAGAHVYQVKLVPGTVTTTTMTIYAKALDSLGIITSSLGVTR